MKQLQIIIFKRKSERVKELRNQCIQVRCPMGNSTVMSAHISIKKTYFPIKLMSQTVDFDYF